MNEFFNVSSFINNEKFEKLPCHPLLMRLAAASASIPFSEYCLDYRQQVKAMMYMAEKFDFRSVHPSGWPYCEAVAYGLAVEFPFDDLPIARTPLLNDIVEDAGKIKILAIENHSGMMNRIKAVAEYRKAGNSELFICGHHEGVFAEYADLRGLSNAFIDLFDHQNILTDIFNILAENAKRWGKLQVEAGADCISIGDAACSQIGPKLYHDYFFDIHKDMVEYYHSLGVFVKVHICGDISAILPDLIKTGADIIDIDHNVKGISDYTHMLENNQVFCGNLHPVDCMVNGTPEDVFENAEKWIHETAGRGILSGGCELPPEVPEQNLHALSEASRYFSAP